MHPAMSDHVRWLEAQLAGFRHRPELHRHQLAAGERYLALARAAATPADYNATAGDLFELTRAEWLDRYFNEACIFRSLTNPRRLAAAAICYRAGYRASGHAELYAELTRGKAEARRWQTLAEEQEASVAPLILELLEHETSADPIERQAHRENVIGLARRFPGGWAALVDEPACRRRLPLADDALALFERWLLRAAGEPTGAPTAVTGAPTFDELVDWANDYVDEVPETPGEPVAPPIPDVAQALAPYRALHDGLSDDDDAGAATRAVCQRIFALAGDAEHGGQLIRAIAEAGLAVELARAPRLAAAERSLARIAGWSQPHAETHYRGLIDALRAARSISEIEYETVWRTDCFETEAAWNEIVLAIATRPLRAALAWEFDRGEERRRSIVSGYRAASELLGLDWEQLLRTPRVWSFVSEVLATEGQQLRVPDDGDDDDDEAPGRGAELGEVGLAVTRDVQKSAAEAVVGRLARGELPDPDRPRFAGAEALAAHATALFQTATAGGDQFARPGAPGRRTLRMWGRPVHIDDLPAALRDPPRPAIELP